MTVELDIVEVIVGMVVVYIAGLVTLPLAGLWLEASDKRRERRHDRMLQAERARKAAR